MATSSFFKTFVIKDRAAFEEFKKATETPTREKSMRKDRAISSLDYGREKLKEFSFR